MLFQIIICDNNYDKKKRVDRYKLARLLICVLNYCKANFIFIFFFSLPCFFFIVVSSHHIYRIIFFLKSNSICNEVKLFTRYGCAAYNDILPLSSSFLIFGYILLLQTPWGGCKNFFKLKIIEIFDDFLRISILKFFSF